MNLLKELFFASRPVSWINTAFPFAAGYFLVTGNIDAPLLIGVLYFLIPYNLLMYGVNDVFDYESDMRNPRKGSVQGAVLQKGLHAKVLLAAMASNVPFLLYLMIAGGAAANAVLLAVVFFVLAYSVPVLRFKERPVLDSITSSIHFVGPLVYGVVLAGGAWAQYTPFIAAFFLWGMASHAFGAVQDIVPDRQGKIASVATALGAQTTVRLAVFWYLIAAGVVMLQGGLAIIAGLIAAIYAINIVPFWSTKDVDSAQATAGWKRFMKLNVLAGFVITMLLIAAVVFSI